MEYSELPAWMRLRIQIVGVTIVAVTAAIYSLCARISVPYGESPFSPWLAIPCAAIFWLTALVHLGLKAARLRAQGGGVCPRLGYWVIAGAGMFGSGAFSPMVFAWDSLRSTGMIMVMLAHLGVLSVVFFSGLAFLVLRVPFRKRTYPIAVAMLGIGFITHLKLVSEVIASA